MEESSAYALRANGERPCFSTIVPAAVKSPSFMRSRRDRPPCDHACRISARLRRAFSASLTRALDAFTGRYIPSLLEIGLLLVVGVPATAKSARAPGQQNVPSAD